MAQNEPGGNRTLWWWPYFMSFAGIVALFASPYVQFSDAAWPVIGGAMSAGLAYHADRIWKRKRDNGDA